MDGGVVCRSQVGSLQIAGCRRGRPYRAERCGRCTLCHAHLLGLLKTEPRRRPKSNGQQVVRCCRLPDLPRRLLGLVWYLQDEAAALLSPGVLCCVFCDCLSGRGA